MTHRDTLRRRLLAYTLGALLAVAALGGCSPYQPPPEPWLTNPPQSAPDRGRFLFEQTCGSCHGPDATGTELAPSLADDGSALLDFMMSTGRMPLNLGEEYPAEHQDPPKLGQSEIDAIIDYVERLHPGGIPIPDVQPGDVEVGRSMYSATCAACHAPGGQGGTLTSGESPPDLFGATPTQVGEAIRTGPGLMPAYPETVLTDDQMNGIAAYVQTLQEGHGNVDEGGLSLGRIGPVTEGLLAWLVAMPLLVLIARRLGSRKQ